MGELDGSESPEPDKVMSERERKAAKADRKEKRRHRKAEKAEREGGATTGALDSVRDDDRELTVLNKVHFLFTPPPFTTRCSNSDYTTAVLSSLITL